MRQNAAGTLKIGKEFSQLRLYGGGVGRVKGIPLYTTNTEANTSQSRDGRHGSPHEGAGNKRRQPQYSLENFAARAIVVPVKKGHGVVIEEKEQENKRVKRDGSAENEGVDGQASFDESTANFSANEKRTTSEKSGKGSEIIKGLQMNLRQPPQGALRHVIAARDVVKDFKNESFPYARPHSPKIGDSDDPAGATVKSFGHSAAASATASLRISGQSLLKTLARRSVTAHNQKQQECSSAATSTKSELNSTTASQNASVQSETASSSTQRLRHGGIVASSAGESIDRDTCKVGEEPKENDCSQKRDHDMLRLAQRIKLAQHLIEAIHAQKTINWDRLPDAIRQLPAYHRRTDFTEHLANAHKLVSSVTNEEHGGEGIENKEIAAPSSAALPLPPILCTGDTGCGKSVLVPLVVMDLHWRGVVIGLVNYVESLVASVANSRRGRSPAQRTEPKDNEQQEEEEGNRQHSEATNHEKMASKEHQQQQQQKDLLFAATSFIVPPCVRHEGSGFYTSIPQNFIPNFDSSLSSTTDDFVREFKSKSRLCIYVAQPTRLASKNLAEFLNASIGSVTHPNTHGWEPHDTSASGTNNAKQTDGGDGELSRDNKNIDVEGERPSQRAALATQEPNKSLASSSEVAEWLREALPLGFRVGYATALDKCMSEESCEIVFATVGYLLNRLSLTQSHSFYSPSPLSLATGEGRAAEEGISSDSEFNILTQSATPNVWAEKKTSREQNHQTARKQVDEESETSTSGIEKIKEAAAKSHYWGTHDAMLPFTLVLDEAHRRDLHSDLLMTWAREWHSIATKEASVLPSTLFNRGVNVDDDALARRLMYKRRLFVMSASIDYSLFRSYFYASSKEEEAKGSLQELSHSTQGKELQLIGSLPFDLAESATAVNRVSVGSSNGDLLNSSTLASPFPSVDKEKALLVRAGFMMVRDSDPIRSAEDIASGALNSIDSIGGGKTISKNKETNDTETENSLPVAHRKHNSERVSGSSPATSPELRSYRKLVIFGDELLQFTDDRQQAMIIEPTKSQKDTNLEQLATSEKSVLHRATPAALEALHAAAFSVADSRMSGHSSRAVREARAGIDVYEAAAKVAVQCVGVNQHVLFFVAGYDELVKFAMAVARITDIPPVSVNLSQREDTFEGEHAAADSNTHNSSHNAGSSPSSTRTAATVAPAFSFLKKDGANFVVDVIALHATAIGEASAQLRSSKAKAKIIVATNVAESSITIPGVSLVLNTGYERVPTNANRRLVTRLASKSSFLQREGRTGRTCDGVVVHLLRRKVYEALPSHAAPVWLEGPESQQLLLTSKLLFPPSTPNSSAVYNRTKERQTTELQSLIPTFSFSSLCAKLPAPVTDPTSLLPQAVQLSDSGVLTNPETTMMATGFSVNHQIVESVSEAKKEAAWRLLDNASLTFKGRFVASLPLPPNLATFVFHGFMYGCLDAALITACALDVNITHINFGSRLPQSVLEAGFYERFGLAKKSEASKDQAIGGTSTEKQTSVDQTTLPSQSPRESIPSDVWLNFMLMDEWYSTRHAEKKDFTVKYLVSLKSMLQADEAVAMAAAKLFNVLVPLYESMGPSEHYAKARLRAALRRLQLLRKHALVNTTVLRSARYNKKSGQQRFMLPTLARCHIPSSDADHNVSLQSRLRAAFIAAFSDNLMVGYVNPKPESGGGLWGDGTRFATSAAASPWLASTVSRASAAEGGKEIITGGNNDSANPSALGAFTLRLSAGTRHLPSSLLAHYSDRDVALALQRMFQNSNYISFDILKYIPRRAALLLQFNTSQTAKDANRTQNSDIDSGMASDEISESLLDDEADDVLPADDEKDFDLNDEKHNGTRRERRGADHRSQVTSRKDSGTSSSIGELDVSQMILDPRPLSICYPTLESGFDGSSTKSAASKQKEGNSSSKSNSYNNNNNNNTSPLRLASFPLWLVAALPHRLREARMPFTEYSDTSPIAAYSTSFSDPLLLEEADSVVESIVRSPDGGLDQQDTSSIGSSTEKDNRIEDPEAQRRIALAKKLIQLGGRLERDKRTGVCTQYHLNEELMLLQNKNENNNIKLNSSSPPNISTVRTTVSNQRDSAAIDLLKAAALGFEEWSPTEKTIQDAIAFLQPDDKPHKGACNGAGISKEAATTESSSSSSSSALIASAAPWRNPSRHRTRNNDGQILANTFLAITSATVPNTVQWVASIRPKIIIESISGYLTSLREERSIHQETAVVVQRGTENDETSSHSVVNAEDSASFLNRIRCPICCEVIPSETKALHITQPRHLSHLRRMINAGVSLNALTRIVANAAEGSGLGNSKGENSETQNIATSFSKSLKNVMGEAATPERIEANASALTALEREEEKSNFVHLSPWHKKLLAEAVSDNPLITRSLILQQKPSSTKNSLASATNSSHMGIVRMKDLVAADDAPRPIPATMGSHSLANLLALDKSHPSISSARQTAQMSTLGRSSAAAISFSVNLAVRASLGTVTANGSWVIDPSQREDAFLLLQAAVLREATVSCPQSRRPLMILVDSTHSFIFGYCVVGLFSVSFGDKPLNASVLQQLLEVKGGAARATTLFGAAEEELSAVRSAVKTPSSSSGEPARALASVPLGGAAITKLQEALIRSLQPFEGQQQQQQVAKVGEERHWCPLRFPCAANECERSRQAAANFAEKKQKSGSGVKDAPSPWSPENPIETLVSGAIISLLHEAQLVGNSRQSLSFFVQRLLSNLSTAAARIGVGGRKRVVEVKVKGNASEKGTHSDEKEDSGAPRRDENAYFVLPVSLETAGGARLLEGYLKQRDAPSLEYVLTYCGCVFPTTQWDGTFFVSAVLPTSVPSPLLMKALDEETVGK